MDRSERAAQLWPLLAWAASNRQTLTYDIAARLTGVPRLALGRFLEPIQSYCLVHELPPLTCVVVSSKTGHPSDGNIEAANALDAFRRVFGHDWLSTQAPQPDALDAAVRERPSNARNAG